jgi:5'-3' exonuclease
MGVPGFFLWLMKNYKKDGFIFQKEKLLDTNIISEIESIDYFLIDTNCLIHPVCFKIVSENPDIIDNEQLEIKMINGVIDYLEKIINYVNPVKGVFIAIDGVAPIAKIKQQRSRRFKSIADKIMFDNIKKKHNKPIFNHWNTNAITPGTIFMEKLHKKLEDWCNQYEKHMIYSSCFIPAEGEHKLLQFIRENEQNKQELSYVIYGLDADLIFLALSTKTENIYLLREANEINKKESKDILNYVSIKIMRKSIISTIKKYLINISKKIDNIKLDKFYDNLDTLNIVNDFIFMCYLLGNDFLPHIPSIDIHKAGIENLIINYVKTLNEIIQEKNNIEYLINSEKTLNSNININQDFFSRFILKLSDQEEEILKENNIKGKRCFKCNGDAYEKELFKIENLQFKITDPIQLGLGNIDDYRMRYYKYYWNINDDELETFSEKLVKHYLIGIKWVTYYYFEKCPSWEWYYPFDHPPFISDISKYINNINISEIKFKLGTPLKPYMQLLAVLPPQSSNLLPIGLRKLVLNVKSSLIFMYPYEFEQDFINKKKYWMGIPNLPPLDIKLIKSSYHKYKNDLI